MGNSQLEDRRARVSTFYGRDCWIEGRAEDQLKQVAGWPGVAAVAGFPDLHPGRFGPVGAAFLADRIYPQLIGPDIGCGMALFRLDLPSRRLKVDKAARRLRVLEEGADAAPEGLAAQLGGAGLGTIGGGNHFCEVQKVARSDHAGLAVGDLCLLVHSGSRGQGAAIFNGIEDSWRDGFAAQSPEAEAYLALHDAAQDWARQNRLWIARRAAEALRTEATLLCDAPHNHLTLHNGLWLHRKGAAAPDRGLAPLAGSRESASYLMRTFDGPDAALASVSHGAGRRYDRASMHGRIRKTRSALEAMQQTPFGGRVICEDRDLLIEEAGVAYKNARDVLRDLEAFGLAKGVAELQPLITYKVSGGVA